MDKNLNVTIDSANTYTGLERTKKLYKHMVPGVVAWDEGSDNRFMLSGVGGGYVNIGSIYRQAKAENFPLRKQISYAPMSVG